MFRTCNLRRYAGIFSRPILALLLVLGSPVVLAQGQGREQWYRVELLVLRHLDAGVADQDPVLALRDFSAALDLMPPPPDEPDGHDESMQPGAGRTPVEAFAEESAEALAEESAEGGAMPPDEEPPPLVVVMTERTETLQEAWRRLRLSADIRPELYLSWQQSADEPFPLIRVHDDRVLAEREAVPAAAAVGNPPEPDAKSGFASRADAQPTVPTFTDANTRSDGSARDREDAADQSGEIEFDLEPALELEPPPILFYQVDGTARLRRSRFLHLELDVEVREPLTASEAAPQAGQRIAPGADARREDALGLVPPGAEFRIHHIRQQRQVRIQEMAYFDGPVVGILALVTRVDPPLPDPVLGSDPNPGPTMEPATDPTEVPPASGN